jgi:hypothetical protein
MKKPLEFSISEDKQFLIVTPMNGDSFAVDATVLEEMIWALAEWRIALKPEVPGVDPVPGTEMRSHPSMRWHASVTPSGVSLVALMHPGFGWIGIPLDREGGEKLISELLKAQPKQ